MMKMDNYYSPEDLEKAIDEYVEYYNYHRYHESLNNMTPADVYFRRAPKILKERQRIKEKTLMGRKKKYIREKLALINQTI